MATLVAVFGGLMTLVGATGVVSPAKLMRGVTSLWQTGRGMHVAVGIRLVMGVVLIAAAPSCVSGVVATAFGVFLIYAGL